MECFDTRNKVRLKKQATVNALPDASGEVGHMDSAPKNILLPAPVDILDSAFTPRADGGNSGAFTNSSDSDTRKA